MTDARCHLLDDHWRPSPDGCFQKGNLSDQRTQVTHQHACTLNLGDPNADLSFAVRVSRVRRKFHSCEV